MIHALHGPRARMPLAPRRLVALPTALVLLALAAGSAQAQVQVDPERLLGDLHVLAHDSMQGRAPGTEGSRMARSHIRQRLEAMGLDVAADTFEIRRRDQVLEGVNLRVLIRGSEWPDRYLALTAHYDHVGVRDGVVYNGADDNASGTSALLALVQDLVRAPPRHSILVAFLDAEEGGLRGARHLVANPPVPLDRVLVNVNLDMVGHSERELWAVGTTQYPALRPLVEAVTPAPPVDLRFGHDTEADRGADNWVTASDHAAFHEVGIPFLYFGVADHEDYHRPSDDAHTIDATFFPAATRTIGLVVRALDDALRGLRPAA